MLQGRYERIKRIGEGSYGVVYKAIDHIPAKKCPEKPSIEFLTSALLATSLSHKAGSENTNPNPRFAGEESKCSKPLMVAIKKLRILEVSSDGGNGVGNRRQREDLPARNRVPPPARPSPHHKGIISASEIE